MTTSTSGGADRPGTAGASTSPGPGQHEQPHPGRPGAPMGAAEWDRRYAGTDLVWGSGANRWVAEQVAGLKPGRAVDLACGEGRNTVYLAEMGWQATGVDFSSVAIGKARELADRRLATADGAGTATFVRDDITAYRPGPMDLALVVYVHLPAESRRQVLGAAASALLPGGHLLVVGHNTRNITDGTGGPQDPDILYTADDVMADLAQVDPMLVVDVAAEPLRMVAGAPRPAIDTVVCAHRP